MSKNTNTDTEQTALPCRILVINPGSTSTKVGVFANDKALRVEAIRHTHEELSHCATLQEQQTYRRRLILDWLEANGIPFEFDAIIGRGGLIKPIPSGVYRVNRKMCEDTDRAFRKHACNLGCLIAYELAQLQTQPCEAFIADPVTVDELLPEARLTGSPVMQHHAIWHALNQRAIARRFASEQGVSYDSLDLIVCHLGGGISVAVHSKGRAIDANNALDGGGPFSPERAGTLPSADLIHLCYSGLYTEQQLLKRIAGQAGLMAHLGTTDIKEIMQRIESGDEKAQLLIDSMIFQCAKAVAAEGAVLRGHVDAILITGGMAHCEYITQGISERVSYLAPVHVYPGEDEMEALALNALAVLQGTEQAKEYA